MSRAAPVPLPGRGRDAGGPAPRARASPAMPSATCCSAAMTAIEDGDFEEGVRRINRILAVRGQVVPVTADAADPPRAHRRRRRHRGPVADHAHDRHRARVAHARRRARLGRRAGSDRRGGPDRPRAGQPLHEPAAEPARARHPRRDPRRRCAPRVRLQRRDAGGRDDGFRPRRARDGPARPHGPRHRDVVLANDRFDARIPTDWQAETVRLQLAADGPRRPTATRARRRRRPRQRPPPRPGPTGRRRHPRVRGRVRRRRRRTVTRTA